MNIPLEIARAQGHHGAKGAAHGIKGGRTPRLALTDEERLQRRRDQQTAYRRRKGIMPRQVLTHEERNELNRSEREARFNKVYREVWRKLPSVVLTAEEFAKRQHSFRRWVRDCQERNSPLYSAVDFVRSHYREEWKKQRAEERANDSGEDYYDDDDDEFLQLEAKRQILARFDREEEIRDLIFSALPPDPALCVGRNQPCPCGSGRKFKKCCG